MVKSYLTVALRNLLRHKGFSAINIFGLALGMSIWLLLILLINDQKNYDQFHQHKERIHRIISHEYNPSIKIMVPRASSPAPLGPALAETTPGIAEITRFKKLQANAGHQESLLSLQGLYAEPSFFQLFDFELTHGDPRTALNKPYSLIITRETADRLFDQEAAPGKIVTLENLGDFVVTGILKDPGQKSHFQFEALASFATLSAELANGAANATALGDWKNVDDFYNYILLEENVSATDLAAQFPGIIQTHYPADRVRDYQFGLEALTDIPLVDYDLNNQLGPVLGSRPLYVMLIFAFVILLAAGFNYVSLTIARSLKRAKEVGVRKVIGARRGDIFKQFIIEAVLISLFALSVAVLLLLWLIPIFNNLQFMRLNDIQVSLSGAPDIGLYLMFLAFSIAAGLVAGFYPALYLSAFLPARVLQGISTIKGFSGISFRKVLTVFQFGISLILIISTAVLFRQLDHMLAADYGFQRENIITVDLQDESYERLKNQLENYPAIQGVSAASKLPVAGSKAITYIKSTRTATPLFHYYYSVDPSFVDNLGLTILAGRNFSPNIASDQNQGAILNETAVRELGFDSPEAAVNQTVTFGLGETISEYLIVGVVKNFNFENDEGHIRQMALLYHPDYFRYAMIHTRNDQADAALAHVKTAWSSMTKTTPLQLSYFDVELAEALDHFKDARNIIAFGAAFAIFIACLGMLGMATYSSEMRVKEVGIRKVFGANISNIVILLSLDYLKQIGLAVIVATPLAWLLANEMLANFAARVGLDIWLFLICIAGVLGLGLLTIGSQTLKAAAANPIDTIRHE